jgi:hypothetical protein
VAKHLVVEERTVQDQEKQAAPQQVVIHLGQA